MEVATPNLIASIAPVVKKSMESGLYEYVGENTIRITFLNTGYAVRGKTIELIIKLKETE